MERAELHFEVVHVSSLDGTFLFSPFKYLHVLLQDNIIGLFCAACCACFVTFLETVRRYTDATTITKRMVAELIQYIEVYPAVKEDGITNQRVTIHYNCIGAFEVPDRRKIPERDILLETRKGVALSYAPTQIAI